MLQFLPLQFQSVHEFTEVSEIEVAILFTRDGAAQAHKKGINNKTAKLAKIASAAMQFWLTQCLRCSFSDMACFYAYDSATAAIEKIHTHSIQTLSFNTAQACHTTLCT